MQRATNRNNDFWGRRQSRRLPRRATLRVACSLSKHSGPPALPWDRVENLHDEAAPFRRPAGRQEAASHRDFWGGIAVPRRIQTRLASWVPPNRLAQKEVQRALLVAWFRNTHSLPRLEQTNHARVGVRTAS